MTRYKLVKISGIPPPLIAFKYSYVKAMNMSLLIGLLLMSFIGKLLKNVFSNAFILSMKAGRKFSNFSYSICASRPSSLSGLGKHSQLRKGKYLLSLDLI
jgi:hypothetical protein